MNFDLKAELAEIRLLTSDPNTRRELVLREADKLHHRLNAEMDSLKDASTVDFVRFFGDHIEDFKELVEIRTGLKTSIALCEEHDRRTRPTLSDWLNGVSDVPQDTKLWLPTLAEYRRGESEGKAASIGSDPGGGYLIQTQSARSLTGCGPLASCCGPILALCRWKTKPMELPRLGTSATVYAVGEAQSKTESSPSYERVRLSACKFAVRSLGSEEWFSDTGTEGRRILQLDQEKQLAAKIDSEFLQGAGAGSSPILGLRNIAGITQTEADAGSGNGGLPGLVDILDAMDRLERDNASPSAIFMHPRTWATFRKLDDLQERLQLQPIRRRRHRADSSACRSSSRRKSRSTKRTATTAIPLTSSWPT